MLSSRILSQGAPIETTSANAPHQIWLEQSYFAYMNKACPYPPKHTAKIVTPAWKTPSEAPRYSPRPSRLSRRCWRR